MTRNISNNLDFEMDEIRGGREKDSETKGEEVDEHGFDHSVYDGRVGGAGKHSGQTRAVDRAIRVASVELFFP